MSRAVELLARMHEVRSITADEHGRQTITGDVVIAVFGKVQHEMPFGMDLLMAKYVHDTPAFNRLVDRITVSVQDEPLKRKDLAIALGCVALDVFCDKPVASQQRQLTSLWRKYSEQAKQSHKLVKRWECQLKNIERELDYCETKSAEERINARISDIESLIIKERRRLNEYAQRQGLSKSICPRCSGTGFTQTTQCLSCDGKGSFTPTLDNIRQHLRHIGLARISDKLWNSELKPWFDECLTMMYREAGEATRKLSTQLTKEKSNSII
ncbi:TIGR02642 family protein [Photobacterium damselae]|uniref:TIGR02642 family protein n=1 Tax=Photobacterium damselae TaxID=38293 RepID=UPI000D661ECF|nr:TIGR02642 family protein [Photobacterium damselae]AWK83839.1 hypothetical protein BST98_17690 [Photobacterium damselae]